MSGRHLPLLQKEVSRSLYPGIPGRVVQTFFRFPRTAHLHWLGKGIARGDKLLSKQEADNLLSEKVVVEEKIDGANLGISLDSDGRLRVQNRGQYLMPPYNGQFSRLGAWLRQHGHALSSVIDDDLILFGEWCAAKHTLGYKSLPDWFLLFDVYERTSRRFWSTVRRNALASEADLSTVPELFRGLIDMRRLVSLVRTAPSRYRQGPLEGVIVRHENLEWTEIRAKLVHPDFTQSIGPHWRSRRIQWNQVRR